MRGSCEMLTLRECARMETTMCKCVVSNNVCVQESVLREITKKTPTRRLRRKMQCVDQERTQKLRIEGNQCQHDRKETPTRRLWRKTQCVERRPSGCAENARDQNRKFSQCPEKATWRESEQEPELVNIEGP